MRIYVHKAATVKTDSQVPDLFIASDAIMLPSKDPKHDEGIYVEEARHIVDALRRSLPEGTYARVLVEMLRQAASDLPTAMLSQKEGGVK